MTKKSGAVINQFLNLTDEEKKEVEEFITKYQKGDRDTKTTETRTFSESFKRIMGPVSQTGCPCCGK